MALPMNCSVVSRDPCGQNCVCVWPSRRRRVEVTGIGFVFKSLRDATGKVATIDALSAAIVGLFEVDRANLRKAHDSRKLRANRGYQDHLEIKGLLRA